MTTKAKIKEMFASIQGEGLYVGYKQLFIRFCGCNLDCDYCDTEHRDGDFSNFDAEELLHQIAEFDMKTIHSISLTGGEPLLWAGFLKEFLPLYKERFSNKVYLETNATKSRELEEIIDFVEIISADIKLPSVSGIENSFAMHDEFFKVASRFDKEIFAKIVFDKNILEDEISNCIKLAHKYSLPLILQPKMDGDKYTLPSEKLQEIFSKFLNQHLNTRVIPQTHKFMQVE